MKTCSSILGIVSIFTFASTPEVTAFTSLHTTHLPLRLAVDTIGHETSKKVTFTYIADKLDVVQGDVDGLEQDVGVLKQDAGVLKQDVGWLKKDVGYLKIDVGTLKTDVPDLKGIVAEEIRHEVSNSFLVTT